MSETTMSNEMIMLISSFVIAPFVYFGVKKWLNISKEKKQAMKVVAAKRAYYNVLTKEKLDKCPKEELGEAAVIHVLRRESEDYDNVYDNLNYSEKVIYVIYEVMNSLRQNNDTLRTFFDNDFYQPFFPMVDEAFYKLGCVELGDLIKAARRFNEIIRNDIDEDEDDEELGDYSNYNYADFTNEFRTLVISLNLRNRMNEFVDQNREDFIDEGIEDDCPELII